MTDAGIPDVDDTDLTRDDMEEVADELGIDPKGWRTRSSSSSSASRWARSTSRR
jgi:hypothetical protein